MKLSKRDVFYYIGCFCVVAAMLASLFLDYIKLRNFVPPARYVDLAKSCVCLCFGLDKVPFGTGFFIGHRGRDKTNRVYLVTAAHVAKEFVEQKENPKEIGIFPHTPHLNKDSRRMMMASGDWKFPAKGEDIGYIDFTEAFYNLRANNVDVRYILVGDSQGYTEPSQIEGLEVISSKAFDRYNVNLGSDVKFIGNILEYWKTKKVERRTRQPLGLRAGVIAAVNDAGILGDNKSWGNAIIVDGLSHQGMSGAAAFSTYRKDGRDYPILIGIVRGALPALSYDIDAKRAYSDKAALSEFTTLNPLDALISELNK